MGIHATMQNVPLTLTAILDGIDGTFGDSEVLTYAGANTAVQATTFSEIATRAAQLANGLACLGVEAGDRVATFMWNNQRHLEAYLAAPCSGAVLPHSTFASRHINSVTSPPMPATRSSSSIPVCSTR